MGPNKYKYYIENCIEELIERTIEAQNESEITNNDFQNGRSLAYKEVITFLMNQTEIFEIKTELSEKIRNYITPL